MAKRKGRTPARKFRWKSKPKEPEQPKPSPNLNLNNGNYNSIKRNRQIIPEGLIGLIEGYKAENRRLVVGWFTGKFQKIDEGIRIQVPFLPEAQLDVFYLLPGQYIDCAGQEHLTFDTEPGYGFEAYTDPEQFKIDAKKAAQAELQKLIILAAEDHSKSLEQGQALNIYKTTSLIDTHYWQAFDTYLKIISYFKSE